MIENYKMKSSLESRQVQADRAGRRKSQSNILRPSASKEIGYKKLIEGLHKEFKEAQDHIDTFYLDEIKQFILTIVTRTQPDEAVSILDEILQYMSKYETPSRLDADYNEYNSHVKDQASDRKFMPCSFIFEQIRSKCLELDNSPWTTYSAFGKEKMGLEKWSQSAENVAKRHNLTYESPRQMEISGIVMVNKARKSFHRAIGSTESFKEGHHSDDDDDIEWFRDLLEESRRYKNRDEVNSNKHFSEFTIDKLLVLKTDAVGANIIHVSYLYKKYEKFGRWLVTQYPTLAVLPYNDEVKYAVRVSAVKEDLHAIPKHMPYTGENILHMTVMNRNLEETRWLLDFYRNHEHNTNDGLKTLLMTAATGNLQVIYHYIIF